jgi:hypothetical protein
MIDEELQGLSDEELEACNKAVQRQIACREQAALERQWQRNRDNILSLKQTDILERIEHSCSSCSDKNPCNGYLEAVGYARCNKCHLMEVLEDVDERFEISIDVSIHKS